MNPRNIRFTETHRRLGSLLWILLLVASPTTALTVSLGLLVPAYGNPGNLDGAAMWNTLETTATTMQSDLVVILNPFNGPGSSPIDPNYVNSSGEGPVVDVRAAGARIIGYVKTEYTSTDINVVKDHIDRYYDPAYWSGAGVQVDGIFIDEMSDDLADVPYYEDLRDYVKAYDTDAFVVGNPGTSFVDTTNAGGNTIDDYAQSADMLVTFESSRAAYRTTYEPPIWLDDYPADRFAHIVHTEPSSSGMLTDLSLAIDRKAGFAYVTDDDLSEMNPYDEIPSYWPEEVDAAIGLIFADDFESGDTSRWP